MSKNEKQTTDGRTMDNRSLHKLTWSKAPGELIIKQTLLNTTRPLKKVKWSTFEECPSYNQPVSPSAKSYLAK